MKLEATDRAPSVILDVEKGELIIEGSSVHENADEFYAPIQQAVEKHLEKPGNGLEAKLYLVYFNTSSSKYFLDIMKTMEEAHLRDGSDVSITWVHDADDLDMKEAGADYDALLQIPVNVIAKDTPNG